MALDITSEVILAFREQQPLFCNPLIWPVSVVTEALCEGDAETGGSGWGVYQDIKGNFKQRGVFYYAAHWLATTYPKGAKILSAVSAQAGGAETSKSVGDESVSYDKGDSTNVGIGDIWLASTSFGQQWLRMRGRAGRGGNAVSANTPIPNQGAGVLG